MDMIQVIMTAMRAEMEMKKLLIGAYAGEFDNLDSC